GRELVIVLRQSLGWAGGQAQRRRIVALYVVGRPARLALLVPQDRRAIERPGGFRGGGVVVGEGQRGLSTRFVADERRQPQEDVVLDFELAARALGPAQVDRARRGAKPVEEIVPHDRHVGCRRRSAGTGRPRRERR